MPAHKNNTVKILGFAAESGTGKTTLLTQVIPELVKHGLRIAMIKHSHHDFEIDQPGKDSYRLHHAGSCQTLLTSQYRSALIKEHSPKHRLTLQQALSQLDLVGIDLVLVEGYRGDKDLPCICCHRQELNKPLLQIDENNLIAIACDSALDADVPLLDINHPQQVAEFITKWVKE